MAITYLAYPLIWPCLQYVYIHTHIYIHYMSTISFEETHLVSVNSRDERDIIFLTLYPARLVSTRIDTNMWVNKKQYRRIRCFGYQANRSDGWKNKIIFFRTEEGFIMFNFSFVLKSAIHGTTIVSVQCARVPNGNRLCTSITILGNGPRVEQKSVRKRLINTFSHSKLENFIGSEPVRQGSAGLPDFLWRSIALSVNKTRHYISHFEL